MILHSLLLVLAVISFTAGAFRLPGLSWTDAGLAFAAASLVA